MNNILLYLICWDIMRFQIKIESLMRASCSDQWRKQVSTDHECGDLEVKTQRWLLTDWYTVDKPVCTYSTTGKNNLHLTVIKLFLRISWRFNPLTKTLTDKGQMTRTHSLPASVCVRVRAHVHKHACPVRMCSVPSGFDFAFVSCYWISALLSRDISNQWEVRHISANWFLRTISKSGQLFYVLT